MALPVTQFVMGLEQECLTALEGPPTGETGRLSLRSLMTRVGQLAPAVPDRTSGLFNPYGRIYVDCGHLELASAEVDSPYLLARIVEAQHDLVRQAVDQLAEGPSRLLLANNNHDGVLSVHSDTWGTHENHLVPRPAKDYSEAMLPFMATRIYGGAGGALYPDGTWLAAVRPLYMERVTGGGTTSARAIFSTSREEHHMGSDPPGYRMHLILCEGVRGHFNRALQIGTTALALKAVDHDAGLGLRAKRAGKLPIGRSWLETLRRLNILAKPGREPVPDPRTLAVQRVYLEGAWRWADAHGERAPDWVPDMLRDWSDTLDALERNDRMWLAEHLDCWARYELATALLQDKGVDWDGFAPYAHDLALQGHNWHTFSRADSLYATLVRQGLFRGDAHAVAPGTEPEPWVPETTTRARTRARFLVANAGNADLSMDWAGVSNTTNGRHCSLEHPLAEAFSDWAEGGSAGDPLGDLEGMLSLRRRMERLREMHAVAARRRRAAAEAARAGGPEAGAETEAGAEPDSSEPMSLRDVARREWERLRRRHLTEP